MCRALFACIFRCCVPHFCCPKLIRIPGTPQRLRDADAALGLHAEIEREQSDQCRDCSSWNRVLGVFHYTKEFAGVALVIILAST